MEASSLAKPGEVLCARSGAHLGHVFTGGCGCSAMVDCRAKQWLPLFWGQEWHFNAVPALLASLLSMSLLSCESAHAAAAAAAALPSCLQTGRAPPAAAIA